MSRSFFADWLKDENSKHTPKFDECLSHIKNGNSLLFSDCIHNNVDVEKLAGYKVFCENQFKISMNQRLLAYLCTLIYVMMISVYFSQISSMCNHDCLIQYPTIKFISGVQEHYNKCVTIHHIICGIICIMPVLILIIMDINLKNRLYNINLRYMCNLILLRIQSIHNQRVPHFDTNNINTNTLKEYKMIF